MSGNMYKKVTDTWNPLGGECPHNCSYCYVKAKKRQFPVINNKYSGKINLSEKEFKSLGKNKFIFICSMNDLFAWGVEGMFIHKIIEHTNNYVSNTYLWQTKNPLRILSYENMLPPKSIVCTTIETNKDYMLKGSSFLPDVWKRAIAMKAIKKPYKQVTIEPIMDFDLEEMIDIINACEANFIQIGADSKHNGLIEPDAEKLEALIKELEINHTVDLKGNLKRLMK